MTRIDPDLRADWRKTALFLPPFPLPQINREELLDTRDWPLREIEKSLGDMERINRFFGGTAHVEREFWRQVEARKLREIRVLDVGTGSAFLPRLLVQEARKRGLAMRVCALDINEKHLKIARQKIRDFPEISPLRASAFEIPLENASVDFVVSTLFLHHFRAPQIEELLREFGRVAGCGFVLGDLVRDAVPLWFFRLSRPVFATSHLTRFDGVASIFRAYTPRELREIVEPLGARVEAHFPYRVNIIRENREAKS